MEWITIPSEEYTLQIYPVDYEELRLALGDVTTMPMLRQFFETSRPPEPLQGNLNSKNNQRIARNISGLVKNSCYL